MWPELGTGAVQMFIWGFCISTVAVAHGTFTVNSLTHLIGRQVYPSKDDSRNSLMIALITMGEGWHNNHHYYQSSVRQGFRWWQIDITYYLLWTMSCVGLVWDMKPVPQKVIDAAGKLNAPAAE
jgi:stearoyl-CoA desaturase (delta-9 desaturase)